MEIIKINKEEIENNCFIIKIGSNDRPATEKDMDDFQESLTALLDIFELDKEPSILITHHDVEVESIDKKTLMNLINKE